MQRPTRQSEQDNWWKAVDDNWSKIKESMQLCFRSNLNIMFYPEDVYQKPIAHDETLEVRIDRARAERDWLTVYKFISFCWEAAPDKPYIHEWPAWGVICNDILPVDIREIMEGDPSERI